MVLIQAVVLIQALKWKQRLNIVTLQVLMNLYLQLQQRPWPDVPSPAQEVAGHLGEKVGDQDNYQEP